MTLVQHYSYPSCNCCIYCCRVKEVNAQSLPVIDVDGGCLSRKWHKLSNRELSLVPLPDPQQPLVGWETLNQGTVLAHSIPKVSHGTMYQYLSSGAGNDGEGKTFRALYRGYNHWASGRVHKIEFNSKILLFVLFVVLSLHP